MPTDITEGVEGAIHIDQEHAFPVHGYPRHVARWQVSNFAHRNKSRHGHLAVLLLVVCLNQTTLNLKSFAALSTVILRRSSSGAPAKMRSRNSRDIGQVDSACGKSLPHSMVSTPMTSRRRTP